MQLRCLMQRDSGLCSSAFCPRRVRLWVGFFWFPTRVLPLVSTRMRRKRHHPLLIWRILIMKFTLCPLAAALLCASAIAAPSQPVGIALITTTTDVAETHIAPFISQDSVDGFPGSRGGWNFADGNAQLMSAKDKQFFSDNSKQIHRIIELRRESKDHNAFEKALKQEKLEEVAGQLSNLGFGTHAASVVARYSKDADIRIHILTIPDPDDSKAEQSEVKKLEQELAADVKPGSTVFDSEKIADAYAKYLNLSFNAMHSENISKYIHNSGVRVVKSEFAFSGVDVKETINKKFKEQSAAKTASAIQKRNMDKVYKSVMDAAQASWCSLPKNNPSVLFLFPAAHSANAKDVPGAGNADAVPSFPASCGLSNPNVLTSTAVNDDGTRISYVDYGKNSIDIAGVEAQPGFLPNGDEYAMHGTCPIGNALTGIAAAIWNQHPDYSPLQVKAAILALGTQDKEVASQVATGKFISRDTLRSFDRFVGSRASIVPTDASESPSFL